MKYGQPGEAISAETGPFRGCKVALQANLHPVGASDNLTDGHCADVRE